MGLVRSAVCSYCLGSCSALVVCARRSRQVRGVGAGASPPFSPRVPFSPRAPRAARCWLSCPGVSFLRLPVRHSMRSVRYAGSARLPFGSAPRVCCRCVRLCSCGVRSPPWVGVARAPRTVPVQGACRPVSGGSCPSACPAPVWCSAFVARGGGGVARSLRPPAWLCVACPFVGGPMCPGRSGVWRSSGGGRAIGGGGSLRATSPGGRGRTRVGRGASGYGGLEPLVRPSASPARAARLALLRHFGHEGCDLHTAPVRVCVLLPGRRPRGVPWGVLVLRRATGAPGRQAQGSATPRGGGRRYQPAIVRAAACGGYWASGGPTARGRAALGHSGVPARRSAPGVSALRRSSPAVISGGGEGGGGCPLARWSCPGPARCSGAGLCRLHRGEGAAGCLHAAGQGGGSGSCQENAVPPPLIGPPYRFSAVPPDRRLRGVAFRVLCSGA